MTREEKLRKWWERIRTVMSHEDSKGWITNNSKKSLGVKHFMWSYLFPGQNPITLHSSMFTDSLNSFGTDEQRAHYLPLMDNLNVIGCYAQTELGHGSNVAGLMTTATFDEKTDTFTLHSPSIKAAKFWPGALGW